ncbi:MULTISPECIES: AAA domain-containing protein [unclassified Bradyrhizobium]|nr:MULTISPECIES: AAA domain-containing protein [unclassified Bradyrhizobium]
MEGMAAFCDLVRERLPRVEQNAVRSFLLNGSVEMLFEVPILEAHSDKLTLSGLRDAVVQWETDAIAQENDLLLLRERARLFTPDERPSSDEVAALRTKIENYLAQEQRLNNRSQIAAALNGLYAGAKTTTAPLKAVLDLCSTIVELPNGRALAVSIGSGLAAHGAQCVQRVKEAQEMCAEIGSDFGTRTQLVETSAMVTGPLDSRAAALRAGAEDPEGLAMHVAFGGARRECRSDLHAIIDEYVTATGGYAGLAAALEALAFRWLARRVYASDRCGPILARFPGARLDFMRNRLAELDREIIAETRKDLRRKLKAEARPPRGNGVGRKSQWTDLALITNEVDKKQKFLSVRELTRRASAALLELKPCWMMSPLAVAQYLPKQGVGFDLCVIDEASQMPPEEAIGALSRSKQAMIVGDTNQLPPSNFFRKMVDVDGDDSEDDTVLDESILELANATFRPARRLRWHYRSKHSGLIKFSNRLVYSDDLVVFPSASEGVAGMGVEFRAVPGLYKAGINPVEAREMVQAAIEFMAKNPNRSLGIVTLNQKQRDLIFEEMEIALGSSPTATQYVDYWSTHNDGLEEFFIKNLENVQGDERDVIFIGTVYGPEELGARVMQRFGPINGTAGKRRLNVLFTRAKQQIVTFSSMSAADISAEPTGNEGAYMLKRWLEYAATGVLESGEATKKEPDSDFEIFVMDQIRAMGCTPVPQVGVKGYSIDIGVRHPQWAHGFILGVECDGATFHSSKSARDRDRLRQQVLEGLGWKFHRIWSTDWFQNPKKQAEILRGVIEARFIELRAREAEFSKPTADLSKNGSTEPLPPIVKSRKEQEPKPIVRPSAVAVGDTVRLRYLTHDKNVVQFTISADRSDPNNGIIYFKKPVAEALLGAEEGDEVEILVGTYVRQAVLEKILARAAPRVH